MLLSKLFTNMFTSTIDATDCHGHSDESRVTTFDPCINSRCRALYTSPSCRECVDSCPSQAIDLSNQTINSELCIQCGQCLVACKMRAIEGIQLPRRNIASRALTLIKHESISFSELKLWADNDLIDVIILDKTDTQNLLLIDRLNQERKDRHVSPIGYKFSDIDISRRSLFSSLNGMNKNIKEHHSLPVEIVQSTDANIELSLEHCHSCFACVRACPTGAISREENLWIIDPALCNQCGTCQLLCSKKAIKVTSLPSKGLQKVHLIDNVCVDCKQHFLSHDHQQRCFVCDGRPNYQMKG